VNPIPDLQFGAALICLQTSTSVIIPKITVTTMLSAITPLVVSSASASRDTQEAEKKAIAKASTWGVTFHRRIRQPSLASLTFARLRDFADKIIWCNFAMSFFETAVCCQCFGLIQSLSCLAVPNVSTICMFCYNEVKLYTYLFISGYCI